MVAACWSPAMPEIAMAAAEQLGHGVAEMRGGILHLGEHRARHPQDFQQLVVPLAGVDVEQQGARGVGGVGGVHLAAGEAPQQIAIDGAEQEFAAAGAFARAGDVVEDPRDLGAGEIGIDDQAGFGRDRGLVAFGLEFGADVGGAAVLPDDGAVDRLAGDAVPHHGGLALVGDADRGDVLCGDIRFLQRLAAGRDRRGPDVLGLVLDPARGRKMLREFLLRGRGDRDVGAEHDGARGCGALIDGQYKGHDVASRKACWVVLGARQADWERFVNMGTEDDPSPSSPGQAKRERGTAVRRGLRGLGTGDRHLTSTATQRGMASRPLPGRRVKESVNIYTDAVVTPPSTTMVWPVMKLEASEPR